MTLRWRFLVVILTLFVSFFAFGKVVSAQTCSGGYNCMGQCGEHCYCNGVKEGNLARCDAGDSGCVKRDDCLVTTPIGCGTYPDCGIIPDTLHCERYSGTCSVPRTCPAGQIYCGSCNSCMPNSRTCNEWAAISCGGSSSGGGGACVSGWCTSAANCSSVGGQQGTYPGGSCSSGLVACCVSSGGGPGPTPTCVWNSIEWKTADDFFMTVGQTYTVTGYFAGGTTWVEGRFRSSTPGIVAIAPFLNNFGPMQTRQITALAKGATTITLERWFNGVKECEISKRVQVTEPYVPGSPTPGVTPSPIPSPSPTPPPLADIVGTVYLDADLNSILDASGLCKDTTAAPAGNIGSVRAVTGGNTYNGTFSGSNYTISGVPSGSFSTVNLAISDANTRCVCPTGCSYSGISAPKGSVNFYVSTVQDPWWQTSNGLIYAFNSISSRIPATCSSSSGCRPFLNLWNSLRETDSSGYAMTGGGGVSAGTLREDTTNSNARIQGLNLSSPRENYDYFSSLYSISGMTANYNCGSNCNKPGTGTYYNSGSATINSPWNVANGEKIVIFVDGNLQVNAPIKVEQGGFLAIIVRGNITIGNQVGNADMVDGTPNVEGVYVADGSLIIQGGRTGGDLRFVGAGTFVGWGGVQMNRTFANGTQNATTPSEYFIFRPDFMRNVPDQMTKPIYIWQETN